jgi:manganese transport protein
MNDTGKPAFDPYARTPEYIQAPPKTMIGTLMKIGPGLILAGAIVGTGELIQTTNLGATIGFALLWLVLFSCFIKVFVQVELGRYTVSSGQTTLEALKDIPIGGTFFTWWWLLMMLGTQTQIAAMVGGVGQALHRLMPFVAESMGGAIAARPDLFWAPVTAIGTSIALAIGSYKLVEVGTTVMVVVFTAVTVACVTLLPAGSISAKEVAGGMSFHVPQGAWMVALAMFGITGVGAAELIVYPYWCIEKGYARYVGPRDSSDAWLARAHGWLRVMQTDAWVSMIVYTLATAAFYILGASVLHAETKGAGLPSEVGALLDTLSRMYFSAMGERGSYIFISVGAVAVLYSTLFASTAANSRALTDFLHVNGYKRYHSGEDRARMLRLLVIIFPLLDLVLYLFFSNPVVLVMIGAVGQALTLPMIAFAALFLRFKRTDPRLRPGFLWTLFLFVSFAAFCVTAGIGFYNAVLK